MKVNVLVPNEDFVVQQRADLQNLLAQPSDKEARPCPKCTVLCPCSKSVTCTCLCSPTCRYCPTRMSSEPDRYPIEEKIVPLVYAFNTARVTPPCWSCEGHVNETDGEIQKYPRVWFYSRSVLYPRLVAEHVDSLLFKKSIAHAWCVRVLSWANSLDTRFCIEPSLSPNEKASLPALQKEVNVIAETLNAGIREKASVYLRAMPAVR